MAKTRPDMLKIFQTLCEVLAGLLFSLHFYSLVFVSHFMPPLISQYSYQARGGLPQGLVLVCWWRLLASRHCVWVFTPGDPPKPLCWPTVSVSPSVAGRGPNTFEGSKRH